MSGSFQEIIERTKIFVFERLKNDSTGHDFFHVERVWKLSCRIAKSEGAHLPIVELAALLHDIADWKFHGGNLEKGPKEARKWLQSQKLVPSQIEAIVQIISKISFKGARVKEDTLSLEAMVVQDADRLDALGAIGIARCFAYGGYKGNPFYDPKILPTMHQSAKEYIESKTTSINHFYEKLLLLKDRMHTLTGKEIAQERHRFMENFLKQFLKEWHEGH